MKPTVYVKLDRDSTFKLTDWSCLQTGEIGKKIEGACCDDVAGKFN